MKPGLPRTHARLRSHLVQAELHWEKIFGEREVFSNSYLGKALIPSFESLLLTLIYLFERQTSPSAGSFLWFLQQLGLVGAKSRDPNPGLPCGGGDPSP